MKKKITFNENQVIEIDGAILTPEVIQEIKKLQDDNNDCISSFMECIADAICFIAIESEDYSGINPEAFTKNTMVLISSLAFYRGSLKNLEKPYTFEINPINP